MPRGRHDLPGTSIHPKKPPRDRALIITLSVMILLAIGFVLLCVWAWQRGEATYAEFMNGCEQDHKHYECMLLWRASRHDGPVVVPSPASIPNSI
jgi:hypothetical protein